MEWRTNLSNDLMMLNLPITFTAYEENSVKNNFTMRIPTVIEVYGNHNLQLFSSLLHSDIDKLQKQFPIVKDLATHFQLMRILIVYSKIGGQIYLDSFINSMKALGVNIKIEKTDFYIVNNNNEILIDYPLFKLIQDTLLTIMGLQKVDNYSYVDPRYAELKTKINKIKKEGSPTINNQSNLSESFVVLTYEFGFTIDEIKNMNVYQMNTYMSYVNKSIQYKVSVVGAGNGLTKKIKYITHKGK